MSAGLSDLPGLRGATSFREREARARSVRRADILRSIDWLLLVSTLALCGLGALLVYSATKQIQVDAGLDPLAYLKRQGINISIGLVMAVTVASVDYSLLRASAPVLYVASLLALAAVLLIGSTINGARSWIVLPAGFQLQPSEFAKVALVVGMAMILGEKRDDSRFGVSSAPRSRDVLLVLAMAALPLGLIMLQPDFGTTLVFVFVILGVNACSGAPVRWVVGLVTSGALLGWAVLGLHLLKPYQEARLTQFAGNNVANAGSTGYNVAQALLANANGSMLGQGLFHGSQTQGQFVPEQKTDFVFTVAGEELGFLGACGILLLLSVILWRALSIARASEDTFGLLVAVGICVWFSFQAFVNIGMTLGIMPVTGLPLPFVSYGGSAMFANLIAIGLLQNVYRRSR
ncbi:MAG: rod shape determining protein RodA [Frankiaceae bacterium]|nr:rod shape determining protein RodA [Frankiaceae bacterium]